MKWHLYTGDKLQVGWADLPPTLSNHQSLIGPFHPNDFYMLIRPTMLLNRWPLDITIGEINDRGWGEEFTAAMVAIDELCFYIHNPETGDRWNIGVYKIEEHSETSFTIHASIHEPEGKPPENWPF